MEGALFHIGSKAITGIHNHGCLTPTIPMPRRKDAITVTFLYFLNLISGKSIQVRGREVFDALCYFNTAGNEDAAADRAA